MKAGKVLSIALAAALVSGSSGCALLSTPPEQRDEYAAIGGLGGGLAGAIIGSMAGGAVAGGLFGMPIGALAGYYIGDRASGDQRSFRERENELNREIERLRRDNERYSRESRGGAAAATASATSDLSSDQVRQVQTRLNQMGYFSGSVDGVWGQETQSALRNFQQSRNLQVTGQLNEQTARALGMENYARAGSAGSGQSTVSQSQVRESTLPAEQRQQAANQSANRQAQQSSAPQQPAASQGSSGQQNASSRGSWQTQSVMISHNELRQVQKKLNDMGFDAGQADGVWGPRTQAAVRSFQQSKNLPATGRLNERTMDALDLR